MTTVSTPLTVQLPVELLHRLNQLSELTGRSLSELVNEALAQFIAYVQAENAATEAALAEIDAGAPLIPHEVVVAWIDSLGTDHELPPPVP